MCEHLQHKMEHKSSFMDSSTMIWKLDWVRRRILLAPCCMYKQVCETLCLSGRYWNHFSGIWWRNTLDISSRLLELCILHTI